MAVEKTFIHFTAYYGYEKYDLQTYANEYRNLMVLLYDKIYIEDFGECKGMGRCGTCAIKIDGLAPTVNMLERNEERTLSKMNISDKNVRLACQIAVDEHLENITVEIIGG